MQNLDQIVLEASAAFAATDDPDALEQIKARYLGKSGQITELLKGMAKLSPDERNQPALPSIAPRKPSSRHSIPVVKRSSASRSRPVWQKRRLTLRCLGVVKCAVACIP